MSDRFLSVEECDLDGLKNPSVGKCARAPKLFAPGPVNPVCDGGSKLCFHFVCTSLSLYFCTVMLFPYLVAFVIKAPSSVVRGVVCFSSRFVCFACLSPMSTLLLSFQRIGFIVRLYSEALSAVQTNVAELSSGGGFIYIYSDPGRTVGT